MKSPGRFATLVLAIVLCVSLVARPARADEGGVVRQALYGLLGVVMTVTGVVGTAVGIGAGVDGSSHQRSGEETAGWVVGVSGVAVGAVGVGILGAIAHDSSRRGSYAPGSPQRRAHRPSLRGVAVAPAPGGATAAVSFAF